MNKWASGAMVAAAVVLSGCGQSADDVLRGGSVSGSAAADRAMELYDSNDDSMLDSSELANCVALRDTMAIYDSNQDGSISRDELVARLDQLFEGGAKLTNVTCRVTNGRAPLANASVTFEPAEFLKDELQPASGVTDAAGRTTLSLADEALPEELKGRPIMQVGLYQVTIDLKGDSVELGHEVDPLSRTGLNPQFDLTKAGN